MSAEEGFKCPECGRTLLEGNEGEKGLVIKSRLVFLNDDGNILCRCPSCRKVSSLPLTFKSADAQVQERPLE